MEDLDNCFSIWRDKYPHSKNNQKYAELHLSQRIRLPVIIHYSKKYVSWFQPELIFCSR